ncbi:MAG: UDP-N-acetylglucosamine pyrophosphorylase related protein [Labilithrix sp.]|nr:UDP-N-acetylglucosamine pyrophosphorylase related protein [Labilithrix sp.]
MTKIDKAIILAAGMGKRIAGVGGPPKPLLPLDDTGTLTFLDWHLRSLAAAGVKEIYLVGSKATFGTQVAAMADHPATWIMNDFPGDVSGSGHSTHLAFTSGHDILDGKSRVVLMDADVVYDPTVFHDLAGAGGALTPRSKTLVCGRFRETDEEVMVFADRQATPRLHGKGLLRTPMVRDLTCLGEATGLLLLEPNDHALWLAAAAWCMSFSTAKTRSEHEDITGRLLLMGALDAVVFQDETRCMECDTPEEYEVVKRDMVPRWIGKLPR